MLTMKSRLKEVYANPVGHDALDKILRQIDKSEKWITNPFVGNFKLSTLKKIAKGKVDEGFFDTLLRLLNSEKDPALKSEGENTLPSPTWWKEAVFYQIYPRSFKDSNGDGIGDLGGIIEKLDYLQDLGITALWLSPIYDSPNDDNGYDIRDYHSIMKEFGTMEDFDLLLSELHRRDMRLIMDLVVNHTSDEHPWFQEALKNPDSKYRDYYFFRKSSDNQPPNNWISFFSGPAWNYYPDQEIWAMHLFSKKQMDLNWDNPELRDDVIKMVNWWLDKGIDGFRMDVINHISKAEGLPDGNQTIHELMGYRGIENYFYGPHLHEYLHQLKTQAFLPHQAFSVGETPGVGLEMAKLLTAQERQELDMIFSFDHLETPGHVRFDDYRYNLNALKDYYMEWMGKYPNNCWMSLFYENHDNPRMISKVNPDSKCRESLAKLLAMIQLTLKGTPFIFQGQEIGMINQKFETINQMRDVESLNLYQELLPKGEKEAFATVMAGSRDHARTPVQWNSEAFAGFSTVEPWLSGDDDYLTCNVENQQKSSDSVLNFYKQLIKLRKAHPALIYGRIEFVQEKERNYFAYTRTMDDEEFFIECNLGEQPHNRTDNTSKGELILSNTKQHGQFMKAYEVNLYQRKPRD